MKVWEQCDPDRMINAKVPRWKKSLESLRNSHKGSMAREKWVMERVAEVEGGDIPGARA